MLKDIVPINRLMIGEYPWILVRDEFSAGGLPHDMMIAKLIKTRQTPGKIFFMTAPRSPNSKPVAGITTASRRCQQISNVARLLNPDLGCIGPPTLEINESMIKVLLATILTLIGHSFSTAAHGGLFTVFVIPSVYGWDLSTPRTLIWSSIKNRKSQQIRPYGHGMYHIRCSTSDGDDINFDELSGVMVNLDYASALPMRHGYGLGTLFATMPGYLESREEARHVLSAYMRAGMVAFLQYKIRPETCYRLAEFVNQYREHGINHKYGLTLDPRKMEGADCTSFIAALLDVAGLHDHDLNNVWESTLLVPYNMVGGPLTGRFIPPRRFFLRPFSGRSWATPTEPHFIAKVYHPDFLYDHILQRWEQNLSPFDSASLPVKISSMFEAKGFIVDASRLKTPTEPLWYPNEN